MSYQSKAYKLHNSVTKKIIISRDVVFDEESTWPWNGSSVIEEIPADFDGIAKENKQQPTQQEISSNRVSTSARKSQAVEVVDEQPKRAITRPIWMKDFVVPRINESNDHVTRFALF